MAETIIDANGLVLGRLASHVAKRLLAGEEVRIVNAEKALVTGRRDSILERWRFKRNVGTQRKGPFYPRMPHLMVKRSVRGMLAYQEKPSHRAAYKRLKCYIGVPDEYSGKPAATVDGARTRALRVLSIGDIARELGAKF